MLSVSDNCKVIGKECRTFDKTHVRDCTMQFSDVNEAFFNAIQENSETPSPGGYEVLDNNKQRTNLSRKREASTSLSEKPKRRDQVRNNKVNSNYCSSEAMDCFSQSDISNSQYFPAKQSNANVCHNVNSESNMNMCHVDVYSSSHKDDVLVNTIEQCKSGKNMSLEDCSVSSSTSDLSINSGGTSVGIQEDLDCLHLTDKSPNNTEANASPSACDSWASPLVPSLFHRVPPTIYFACSGEKVHPLPAEVRKLLKWKLSTITPVLIRQTVERSGFQLTKDNTDWIGTWGKHMKCISFKSIKDYQKVNHFPGSFYLGRKDKMSQIYSKMLSRHSIDEFSFFPETFVLPQDIRQLRNLWGTDGGKKRWIIKPPASARGTGIKVINKWTQIPKKRPVIVQRYLSEPYLINDAKFDLRLYVLVPNYDPLRVYIFDDGLVRFASVKYSLSAHSLNDPFMHLTNYSINRKNAAYTANDGDSNCEGHKWSLKALWTYMEDRGIDTKKIWDEIIDLVIKTIICSEGPMTRLVKNYTRTRYNCFELFGFDIMLDKNLKPWLLEVNISPSLQTSSSLDLKVKGPLAKDMLNVAGFQIPEKGFQNVCSESVLSKYGISSEDAYGMCMNKALHYWYLSPDEKAKHTSYAWKDPPKESILSTLTPDDIRQLIESEDELQRCGSYIRLFPSSSSSKYLKYFEYTRYYNILLDAWEEKYHDNRNEGIALLQSFCQKNIHLQTVYKDCSFTE